MVLADGRKPLISIFLAPDVVEDKSSTALFAARELRYYLGRITAVSFPIEAYREGANGICVGACANIPCDDLGEDGFTIQSRDGNLCIAGGNRGVIYGVYEFLESLGCRFFTPDCEEIPTNPSLSLSDDYHITQKPAFEYRGHNYADLTQSHRFAVKCRVNGSHHRIPSHMGGNLSYAWHVHTFEKMVPTAIYGETHPEYYALVDGKRVVRDGGRTQLCLTNPDVLDICVKAVRKILLEKPECRIVSVSQNDWNGNYCTCENCARIDEEEGSHAGSLIHFVNRVAEILEPEFPHIIFDTLAYTYTRPAPKYVRNRHNVCVRLCSIEACFTHPFTAGHDKNPLVLPDGTTRSFINDLQEWGRICDRIYIWDYTTCFAHYPTPHPNWRVLQPNAQAMYENNVRGVFEQANGASRGGVDFNELRAYLISKLLWNPYCDLEKHRQEFLHFYYGAAAPFMDEYLNLICDTAEARNDHVGFNDAPTHKFLEEDMLDRYDAIFQKALQAVAGDPLRLWRVEKNRLSIRYVRLKRATMLKGEYNAEDINSFFADWRAFHLSRLDEWCNLETSHRAMLEGKWRGVAYMDHWTDEDPEVL